MTPASSTTVSSMLPKTSQLPTKNVSRRKSLVKPVVVLTSINRVSGGTSPKAEKAKSTSTVSDDVPPESLRADDLGPGRLATIEGEANRNVRQKNQFGAHTKSMNIPGQTSLPTSVRTQEQDSQLHYTELL